MPLTILGIILLLCPFLALKKFKDVRIGMLYIILFVLSIQLVIALITQALNIFYYQVILGMNLLVFLGSLFLFRFPKLSIKSVKKIDWSLFFVVLVAFIALYCVHYSYTGSYSTATKLINKTKTPFSYPYPYFSDEWYAVAFIKDAITTHSLPIRDPIWKGPFTNLELAFHSLLAEVTLLLRLNPLTGYVILSIGFNVLIVVLLYFFLTLRMVKKPVSAIASLSALYIANASSLPGLWTLLPLSLGIIFLLLTISFYSLGKRYMQMLASFLTLIFYPPLVIFVFILIFSGLVKKRGKNLKELILYGGIICVSAFFVSALYMFDRFTAIQVFNLIAHKLFYTSYLGNNFISSFPIYYVIPIPILFFALFGFYILFKKNVEILGMIIASLVFWIIYSLTVYRFIIDFERLIIVSCLLIIIAAGFGLNALFERLERYKNLAKSPYLISIPYIILFLFIPLLPFYTNSDAWKHFIARRPHMIARNLPLANQFLQTDDLQFFKDIKNKLFLCTQWKGTVLGVATDNIPSSIKEGTVSGEKKDYLGEFQKLPCLQKDSFAKKFKIDYVYSQTPFSCNGFELKGVSKEKFYFYQHI